MKRLYLILGLLGASLAIHGCNLTGGVDDPNSVDELLSSAQVKIEQEDCQGAIDSLNGIANRDDRVNRMLGWAHLCKAGASINKVGASLFAYNSGSSATNLSIIGNLANQLVPSTPESRFSIEQAISAFSAQGRSDDRQVNIALAQIVKASALMAKYASTNNAVERADVAPSSCLNTTCSAAPAACDGTLIEDNDANIFGLALSAAQSALSGLTSAGALGNLTADIGAIIAAGGGAAAARTNRCVMYNQTLTR